MDDAAHRAYVLRGTKRVSPECASNCLSGRAVSAIAWSTRPSTISVGRRQKHASSNARSKEPSSRPHSESQHKRCSVHRLRISDHASGAAAPKVSEPRSGCPSGEPSPLGNPMGLNRQNSELCRVPSSCFSGARTRNAEVNQRQEFECSAAYEAGGREFESLRARPHQWVYSGHIDLPKPPTGRDATLPAYAR